MKSIIIIPARWNSKRFPGKPLAKINNIARQNNISLFEGSQIFVNENNSKRTIRIEALLQNGAMGIIIGAQIFSEIIYITPIAIYALVQYIILLFYIGNVNLAKSKKR